MTTMSSHLVLLNGVLAIAACVLGATTPRAWYPHRVTKPRGRWLAESDSEDEGGGGQHTPTRRPKVKLPSQMVAEANAAEAERRSSGSASALSSPISPGEGRRRRLSPAPGADAVIDIGSPQPPQRASPIKRDPPPTHTHLPHSRAGRPLRPRTHLPFLSVYRAHMMVMTVLAILAVDFPVFPRVLGKTEDWGTGLMDVGVGSFVFSLGIVSSKAFSATRRGKMLATLLGALRRALPVLALGFVRLLMVKGVEYPVSRPAAERQWTAADGRNTSPSTGFTGTFSSLSALCQRSRLLSFPSAGSSGGAPSPSPSAPVSFVFASQS